MPAGSFGHGFWNFVAGHYAGVKSGLRGALRMATAGETVLGDLAMSGLCRWLHNAIRIPLWTPATPKAYNIPKSLRALVSSAAVGRDGASVVEVPGLANIRSGHRNADRLQGSLFPELHQPDDGPS